MLGMVALMGKLSLVRMLSYKGYYREKSKKERKIYEKLEKNRFDGVYCIVVDGKHRAYLFDGLQIERGTRQFAIG